jgi:nitroreductase
MSSFETILNLTGFREARDEVIEREKVGRILEAGRNTPSPGNVQTLEFIAVEDEETLHQLSQTLGDHRIGEAPLTVVVISDNDRMRRKVGANFENFCMGEAATSVQNMRIAAKEEGISSVWKAGFDSNTVGGQLNVPDGKQPMATVSFAYTDHPINSEPKFGMNEVVFYDEYGAQIKSHFDGLHWKGLREEREIFGKKKKGFLTRLKRKIDEVL